MQKTINTKIIKITAQKTTNVYASNIYIITIKRKNSKIKQQIIVHNVHNLQQAIKNNYFVNNNTNNYNTQQKASNYFKNNVLVHYSVTNNNNIVQRYTQNKHYNKIAQIALNYFKLFNII